MQPVETKTVKHSFLDSVKVICWLALQPAVAGTNAAAATASRTVGQQQQLA